MRKHLTLLAVLVLSSVLAFAQTKLITGRVTDQQGQPVPFSTIRVKGTKKGVSADADGNYSIRASIGETLIVSGAGIELKEATVGAGSVDITVARKNASLTEVVVVGYGVQKKSDVIGNIASVKGAAIADNPVQSFDAALGGKAAGVQITSANGVVNNPPVFRIRGTNSISLSSYPLIVIDGVPTFTGDVSMSDAAANPLASINPADIESLDVLKDAAATAIYGSRAANGVVIITTKRGKRGKTKVTYSGWVGQTKATRLWKTLNADQYMMIKNEGVANKPGATAKFLPTNGPDGKEINTDWKDLVYRTGISHSHALTVSGGNEATTYFISAGYTKQNGIVVKNSFERKNFRFSIDHKVSNVFSLGAQAGYSNEINLAATSTGSLPGQAYSTGGLGRIALILPPNIAARNNDGTYNTNGAAIGPMNNVNPGISYYNPLVLIENNHTSTENNHIQANAYLQLKPIPDVTLKTVYGVDYLLSDNDFFSTPLNGDGYPGGEAINSNLTYKRWIWTSTGQYDHIFADKHTVGLLVGTEQQYTTQLGYGIDRTNVTDPFFTNGQGGFADNVPATVSGNTNGLRTENYLVSGFGRLNYDFDKRYFVSGSFRRDGYSAFAPGHKYGNFWSASVAYDIAKESFFTNSGIGKVINTLRLRGSYGTTGNISGIGDFDSYSFYGTGLYNSNPALNFTNSGNSNLTWETSKKTDIGLQFSLLNDVISGDVAWYRNNIDGLIIKVTQAGSTGIPGLQIPTNIGTMYNKGFEVTLNARPVTSKNFRWTTSLNVTYNKNMVTSLAPGLNNILYTTSGLEQTSITMPGYSIGTLYLYPTQGVDPATGHRIFLNGAGEQIEYGHETASWTYVKSGAAASKINPAKDKRPLFNVIPKYYGGFENTFRYGSFDLGILATYEFGFYVYNGTQASIRDNRFWNSSVDVLRRWTHAGQITDIPKIVYGDNISNGSANPISENAQKGDFIKLRNVSLGYALPAKMLGRIGINNARVYVSGQNLLVITKYKGPDPETSTNGNDTQGQGVDRNSVANGRVFTVGLNVGF
ncbi:TonB-dependent receptor [Flavitalea sp. BT771]|uniref:SusC/RagA family TonB-linked outer membrane protein n=1 Tax=Flavitalea sp. BT771 TaxID=3063329 RepID=UPI0026E2EDFA|nr:TonB-dependent receptor [Flavitalea sp. BT771]MDO6429719.1 TonB-dependent receptor [Flavitalea sp. BT771]MDV6218153.1 TonB-dependent receptor [Flavitalea sp. BT771]